MFTRRGFLAGGVAAALTLAARRSFAIGPGSKFKLGQGASAEALGSNLPAMTLIGVARLAFPELKVEIEAIAAK